MRHLHKLRKFTDLTALLLATSLLITGCASGPAGQAKKLHALQSIAIAPPYDSLAAAIGTELSNHQFRLTWQASTNDLLTELNIDPSQVTTPEALNKLQSRGIDALMTVSTTIAWDNKPKNAWVRLFDTRTGNRVINHHWRNGRDGQAVSDIVKVVRLDELEAAREISRSLLQNLQPTKPPESLDVDDYGAPQRF